MARLGGVQQTQQRQALRDIGCGPEITMGRDHFEREREREREVEIEREGLREWVRQMRVMR